MMGNDVVVWRVKVYVDEKGGDDDVFTVGVRVRAATEEDALAEAERIAVERYGAEKVMEAWGARAE